MKNKPAFKVVKSSVGTPEALALKLAGLKDNQRAYSAAELAMSKGKTKEQVIKSAGVTATRMWGDVFNEEYISELKGVRAAIVYENMLRSDYQVGLLEESIMGIIKAAHFNFTIPGVPNGDKHAELCQWQWQHGFNKTVDENLNDLGSHIFFGFAVFEPVEYEAYTHPMYGTIWRLKTMGFRDQSSITEWHIVNGTLEKVHQQTQYSTPTHDAWMDGNNLIVLTEKRKGDNYEGRALLRKAYGPAWRKNVYYKLLGIGLEKAAMGMILVTVPPNKVGQAEEDAFLEAVANYVTHENSYLKKTGKMTGDKFEGFDIEVIAIDFKADAVTNAIRLEDTNIAKCGAAAFSELGQGGNGGAYSLGVADIDFFFSMVTGRIRYICEKTQRIWDDLIKYNYGEQKEYPVLTGELDEKAGEELARILNYYFNIGVYTPQPEDEIFLRKRHNLPELKIPAASEPKKEEPVPPVMPPIPPTDEDGKEEPTDEGTEEEKATEGQAEDKNAPSDEAKDGEKMSRRLSKQEAAYVKGITKGIDFKAFDAELEGLTETWNKGTRSALQAIQDKYLNDLQNKLKFNPNNKMNAVINIEMGFTAKLKEVINENILEGLTTGKGQGKKILSAKKKNLSFKRLSDISDFLPANRNWAKSTGAVVLKTMLSDFDKRAVLAAKNALDKGLSDAEVMFEVRQGMDDWKMNDANLGAGAVMPTTLDVGREEAYYDAGVNITGWIYMNYDPVTSICNWLNNRTAREGDPDIELYSPPNHWGCKSFKIPIMSDEEQPEVWDGWNVPGSILSQQALLSNSCCKTPDIWKGIIRRVAA